MSCPNKPNEGLCLTCRLGGLIRCPELGTPLPLAEAEKPRVTRRVYEGRIEDVLKLWGQLSSRRRD